MSEVPDFKEWVYDQQGILSDEERLALFERSDYGITPAPMRRFESLRDFVENSNNFHAHFTSPADGLLADVYRSKKAYARFELVRPDLNTELRERLEGSEPSFWQRDRNTLLSMFLAHEAMRKLVDISDPFVVIDGKVNGMYLCQ
jgi:hypothetical protein